MQKITTPFEKTVVEALQATVGLYDPRQKKVFDLLLKKNKLAEIEKELEEYENTLRHSPEKEAALV